jgi:hypothetical protein
VGASHFESYAVDLACDAANLVMQQCVLSRNDVARSSVYS